MVTTKMGVVGAIAPYVFPDWGPGGAVSPPAGSRGGAPGS